MAHTRRNYDLAVIGGGAAGLAAATHGGRQGATVALIEAARLGGDCTWTGCVPSKSLLEASARDSDPDRALTWMRDAVARIAEHESEAALRAHGVDVVNGRARFAAHGVLDVDGRRLEVGAVVIATGAGPAVPPIDGLEDVPFLTTDSVFDLDRLPSSMAVLGGGPIGVELGQALARLGVRVTLLEALDRVLPGEEPEASSLVERALSGQGAEVRTGDPVVKAERTDAGVRLHTDAGVVVETEAVLVAAGRRPHTDGLALDAVGVQTGPDGAVTVDDRLRTGVDGVFAAGDVTGLLPFTHAADEMGRVAAANALGRARRRFEIGAIPIVVFTDPEVARVGGVEADAPRGARVAEVPMREVDRAVVAHREDGFVKLIAAPRRLLGHMGGGRLVGATVVGPRGGEMIHEAALAVQTKMFTGRLAQTVHAYPTWSVAMRKAAAQFFQSVDGREARPPRR